MRDLSTQINLSILEVVPMTIATNLDAGNKLYISCVDIIQEDFNFFFIALGLLVLAKVSNARFSLVLYFSKEMICLFL